jgi:hypothetical protein
VGRGARDGLLLDEPRVPLKYLALLIAFASAAACGKKAATPESQGSDKIGSASGSSGSATAGSGSAATDPAVASALHAVDDFDRILAPIWKLSSGPRLVATCARFAQLGDKGAALKAAAPSSVPGWSDSAENVSEMASDLRRVCQQYPASTLSDPKALAGVVGDFDRQEIGPLHDAFAKLAALLPGGHADGHASDAMTPPDASTGDSGSASAVADTHTLAGTLHALDSQLKNALDVAQHAQSREAACVPVPQLLKLAQGLNAPGIKAPSGAGWEAMRSELVTHLDDISSRTCDADSSDDASVIADRLQRIRATFDEMMKLAGA